MWVPNFNSIKVRLEPEARKAEQEADYSFQFHKGAIRTVDRFSNLHRYHYFNSIKVRLELTVQLAEGEIFGFQFHKGAIRTRGAYSSTDGFYNFNSIKVRLEQGI